MTMWHFNPAEPLGNPTQPGPWRDLHQVTGFDKTDLYTHGKCADCAACPKVWRLEVPGTSNHNGIFYLKRMPYFFNSGFWSLCSWTSLPAMPFPDRQTYGENFFLEGWTLTWQLYGPINGFRWMLYTPLIGHDFTGGDQSVYVQESSFWKCLEPNGMRLHQTVGEFPFPEIPEFVSLTPHPA